MEKFKHAMKELILLYGPAEFRKNLLICHFSWCVTSLSYYAIGKCFYQNEIHNVSVLISILFEALNADNFDANRYMYVAITGFVEVPSYIIPIIILRYVGRKQTSLILFLVAGASLLALLAVPEGRKFLFI